MNTPCLWDFVEADVTSLNETKSQPYSSLYQLETCVRLTPRSGSGHVGQGTGSGHIGQVLCSSSDIVVVAVENQLMLFSAGDRQLVAALNFESVVDCVACNQDGSLLVVAERSGDVHAVSAKTGEQIASQRLETTTPDDETSLFKAVEFGGGVLCRLAVLTSVGRLHVIDGLQCQQLKHSVIETTDAALCLTVLSSGDIITCHSDESLISLWSTVDGQFVVVSSCPMLFGPPVKCASLPCGKLVLVLDSNGRLVLWNTRRFVAVSMLDCADVMDFVLVDRPTDSAQCTGTVATLQKSETSCCINVYTIPRTELIYSVDVEPSAILFPSSVLNDCVYLLEMRTENAPSKLTDVTSSWQVRRLAEADPQTHLRRLLVKQRFSEAETFAEKFDLDVQLVYHECVCHLLMKLSVSVDDDVSELMTELTKCLGRLNDVKFVVECCINTGLPQLAATNQLLSLARERLQKWRGLSAELHASLDTQLHETTRRLAAFQVTHFHLYSQAHVPPFRLHTFIICTVSLILYDYLATAMSRKVLLLSRYVCNCVVMFITSFLTVIVIMAERLGGHLDTVRLDRQRCEIVPLNSPGGTTVQCITWRGLII